MLLVLLLACGMDVVVSEQPLIPEGKSRFEPELVGTWGPSEGSPVVSFAKAGRGMSYSSIDGDRWLAPEPLPLLRVKDQLYTQLPWDDDKDGANTANRPAGLWCWFRLDLEGDHLHVDFLSPQWFYERREQDLGIFFEPLRGAGRTASTTPRWGDQVPSVLLRGSTRELRRWLRRHQEDRGLFMEAAQLVRLSAEPGFQAR